MQNEEQITLEKIEMEIRAELSDNTAATNATGAPNALNEFNPAEPATSENATSENAADENADAARTSRKPPYRITDFDSPRDKEMAVFTHAKKLSEYIFVITEKSPKKLRWSIVSRLQNASVEVVEHLYRANFERDETVRLQHQRQAMVSLRLLDFYTETARKKQAITIRQTAIIAQQLCETDKLLNGWIRSTKKK